MYESSHIDYDYSQSVCQIARRMQERGDTLCTSVFAVGETLVGPSKTQRWDEVSKVREFFRSPELRLLDFKLSTAEIFAEIRGRGGLRRRNPSGLCRRSPCGSFPYSRQTAREKNHSRHSVHRHTRYQRAVDTPHVRQHIRRFSKGAVSGGPLRYGEMAISGALLVTPPVLSWSAASPGGSPAGMTMLA